MYKKIDKEKICTFLFIYIYIYIYLKIRYITIGSLSRSVDRRRKHAKAILDKSNSTTGAERVEANLPETLTVTAQLSLHTDGKKLIDLENEDQSINVRNGAMR